MIKQTIFYKNLEWTTHNGNVKHRDDQGRGSWQRQWGEDNVSSKLTLETVLKIRSLSSSLTRRQISDLLGVHIKEVGRIQRGDRWDFPEAWPD